MKLVLSLALVLAWLAPPAHAAAKTPRAMTIEDFLTVGWVSQLAPSPDGRWVAFRLSRNDLAGNKARRELWLAATDGSGARRLTTGGAEGQPAWSPDSKNLYFVARRGAQSEPQLWTLPLDGGEASPLPEVCTGVSGPLVSPDGAQIAFTAEVFPDCPDLACTCARLEARDKPRASGQVYDGLLYRHWNSWRDERRSHVLLLDRASGAVRDLTPGPHDAPPIALGGDRDVDFAPAGDLLAYVANTDPVVALSTNNDVFVVPTRGGKARRISSGPGNDYNPRFSPDGRALAYLSMERAGYEADRPRLMVTDLGSGATRQLATALDRTITELAWAPDGQALYLIAQHHGLRPIYRVALTDGVAVPLLADASYSELGVARATGRLSFRRETFISPPEVHAADPTAAPVAPLRLSRVNDERWAELAMPRFEESWFSGAKDERVQAWLLTPSPAPAGKLPLVLLLHGGPQGSFDSTFHPRWNAAMYASAGFAVGVINFHGSTGFGQAFSDAVSRDWGGAPYEDVMRGLDHLLARYPALDKTRVAASGASYGGYLINWIAGHTDRFRALISHAGVFNLTAKYGSTEELWFPQWEFGGTPWDNPELYERWSPHRFVSAFKTPTLVIHGANDFRVPLEQGLGMYTALQRRGVKSRLLVFPDEDHFVQKPLNAQLWWQTKLDWLRTNLR